jgi:predicted permease
MILEVRHALRRLRQRPAFSFAAIATLALGIGFSTVVFSLVNFLLLRPLPVSDPESVVSLHTGEAPGFSFPNYLDIREGNDVFSDVAALRVMPMHVNRGGEKARLWGYLVTGNYFDLLGVGASRGRLLAPSDDVVTGGHPVAVVSHASWQRRFGSDPDLVGSTIRVNGHPFTIVGVAPPGFVGTERILDSEIWVPFSMIREIEGRDWREWRRTGNAWIVGRLKPGLTRERAEASLALLAGRLALDHPEENEGIELLVADAGLLGNVLRGPVVSFGGALLAVSALTLLVACANLSNLLLAQAASRRKEYALRLSLGASRAALVRMMLAETQVLALAGGASALIVSIWLGRALDAWLPALDFPVNTGLVTDGRVMAFALALSLASALFASLWPAFRSAKLNPAPALKSEAAPGRFRHIDVRDLYVGVQVLVSIVLVSSSLMMVRTLQQALSSRYGFDPEGAVALRFDVAMHGYDEERGSELQRRVLEAVRALPGIEGAGLSNSIPFSIDQSFNTVYVEGEPIPPISEAPTAVLYQSTPGLFRAIGTRIVAGRDFDEKDDGDSPPVAVVNQSFVSKLVPAGELLGRRLRFHPEGDPIEIVGIVEQGKYQTVTEPDRLAVFRPLRQSYNSTSTLVVRTPLASDEVMALLRRTIEEIDPELALFDEKPLADLLDLPTTPLRIATTALGAMGALAALLSALGLHALVAFATARRTREIGIRVALGASHGDVVRGLLKRASLIVGVSSALGLSLSFVAMRVLASLLHASPDAILSLAAAAVMGIVSVAAAWGPARRALDVEPSSALRYE